MIGLERGRRNDLTYRVNFSAPPGAALEAGEREGRAAAPIG